MTGGHGSRCLAGAGRCFIAGVSCSGLFRRSWVRVLCRGGRNPVSGLGPGRALR
ncbi:MAG: hypothetical protein ACTTJZ_02030 [Sphaerochaetaceae bacterium]